MAYRYQSSEQDRRIIEEPYRPASMDDILAALKELIRLQRRTKAQGRLYTWEFTLYGGSQTITPINYDPTTDSISTQPLSGTGKNTVQLDFVRGIYYGKDINDTATPFIFPNRPLYAFQIINEIPSGAGTGADVRVSANTPYGDNVPRVLVRSNDSYSSGIQNGPTFNRLTLVNNQATNTSTNAYVRVIGMV